MSNNPLPIIKPQELLVLKQTTPFVLVDARSGAKETYAASHLEGAFHVDLNNDLADIKPDAADGGRHPLPNFPHFNQVLSELGITPDSHVVIYDDKNGANAAARFWWMLKSIGHDSVQVLDGGMDAAIRAGYPLSNQAPKRVISANYEANTWQLPTADIVEVDTAIQNAQCLIIDVREDGRYNGAFEPLDLIAGHIPNAVNIPFSSNLDAEGYFLPPSVLREKYKKALNERDAAQVIVHCGSGVTACHTLLAMAYAGMDIPKLYVGSWSEWSRNNRPMVIKP